MINEILRLYKEDDIEYHNMCEDIGFDYLLDYIIMLETKIKSLEKYNHKLNLEAQKYFDLLAEESSKVSEAIEYLEQPYRDNFDYSKAELLNILQGDNKE